MAILTFNICVLIFYLYDIKKIKIKVLFLLSDKYETGEIIITMTESSQSKYNLTNVKSLQTVIVAQFRGFYFINLRKKDIK